MDEFLHEFQRLELVSQTLASLVAKVSSVNIDDLAPEEVTVYRVYVSDIANINNHIIESYAKQQKTIRSLKAQAFSLKSGETVEDVQAALDRAANQQINIGGRL